MTKRAAILAVMQPKDVHCAPLIYMVEWFQHAKNILG